MTTQTYVLLLLLLPCASPLTSGAPYEFALDKVQFDPPVPTNPFASRHPGPGMSVNVAMSNVLPYVLDMRGNGGGQGKESFGPMCDSIKSTIDCSKSYCPPTEACANRLEFLATRHLRLANLWNNTLKSDDGDKVEEQQQPRAETIQLQKLGAYRASILEYVYSRRASDPSYRVLDVGGLADPWSWPIANTVLDFTDPFANFPANITAHKGDITRAAGWSSVLSEVTEKGKFDFVICTHTLEDLHDPQMVVDMLPRVAKAGAIAVPSRFLELSKVVAESTIKALNYTGSDSQLGYAFRGYFHHFWVFTVSQSQLIAVPKSNLVEDPFFDGTTDEDLSHNFGELQIYWSGPSVPVRLFNNGYDDLQAYANLPTEGFYSDHIAGLHAIRETISDDDLSIFSGLLASVDVQVGPAGIKKLRLYDDEDPASQVRKFCSTHEYANCETLHEDILKYIRILERERVPFKKVDVTELTK